MVGLNRHYSGGQLSIDIFNTSFHVFLSCGIFNEAERFRVVFSVYILKFDRMRRFGKMMTACKTWIECYEKYVVWLCLYVCIWKWSTCDVCTQRKVCTHRFERKIMDLFDTEFKFLHSYPFLFAVRLDWCGWLQFYYVAWEYMKVMRECILWVSYY